MGPKLKIVESYWLIVIAFLLFVGPLALDFHFYYPDEVHYTEAAIQMTQTNNYLTPLQGSGEMRFNKPIITYWFVVLGYKLFGINAFASRFFFLIAGALILLLVYQIGKLIYPNSKTAYMGTAIAATQITLIMSSMRSIPDILLCLFITLSALGFSGFIKYGNNAPVKYNWMIFVGLALAFEVKGIQAVVLGTMALVYLMVNQWQRVNWKKLFHIPSLITGLIIAFSWFIVMFIQHDQEFIQSFYHDQVGTRISMNIWIIMKNLALALIFISVLFIPWITFLSKNSFHLKSENKEINSFTGFVISSIVTTLVLSAFVFKFYERYLLPIIPISAVWLGHLIAENVINKKSLIKFWGILLFSIHAVLLSFAFLTARALGSEILFYILLVAAVAFTLFVFIRILKTQTVNWLILLILLTAFNISLITYNISFPNEGEQIAMELTKIEKKELPSIGVQGYPKIASKLRVATAGKYQIINITGENILEDSTKYDVLVVGESDLNSFPAEKYEIKNGSVSWNSKNGSKLLQSIVAGSYKENLKLLGKKYYLLQRKSIP